MFLQFTLSCFKSYKVFYNRFPLSFGRPRPRLTCSLTTRAGFKGHVEVDVEAIEVREEQVDEYFRDVLVIGFRGKVFVMKFTCSCNVWRCDDVIFLTEKFLVSSNDGLLASRGRFIHSSSILKYFSINKNRNF